MHIQCCCTQTAFMLFIYIYVCVCICTNYILLTLLDPGSSFRLSITNLYADIGLCSQDPNTETLRKYLKMDN